MRFILLCIVAAAGCLIIFQAAWADVADLEKDLQSSLEQSGKQVSQAARKLERGLDASPEIDRLRTLSEKIRITHLLMEERFRLREEKVKTLGSSALNRQQAMAEVYRKALTEYLGLIDSLPAASGQESGVGSQEKINKLNTLLDKLIPKKKRPIIGSLPYKHLNLQAIEPTTVPAITPAYKGGNKTVSPDDTAATSEAPISKEIAFLAQSLNWNPVSIYEYVKNNVETEWYRGCMKGAEGTLHQKSGNDCDQAALLVALLRASTYPTRYVRGVLEFFPDIERARNLIGIDDPAKIAEFFRKAGIPYKLVIAGGKIANFQIEHIWVETQVPYSNYRGSIIDEHGKAWLGLDTSIKVKGYEYGIANDLFQEPGFSSQMPGIRDEYLGLTSQPTNSLLANPQLVTPLEYLQARINSGLTTQNSELTYNDFLRNRTLLPENMKILPASLQFEQAKVMNEYAAIPDELIHKVRFIAKTAQNFELLNYEIAVLKLSNQQITLSYEPETVQDQEIINSFGGLDNTPAYLVRLRPVLKVNGDRVVVGTDGLPMGSDLELAIELISPNSMEKISNTLIVGNLSVIGMTSQKVVITPSPLAGEGGGEGSKDAERLLYESAQYYIDRWNNAEDELASLLHLSITRPLPTVVILGGVIDVTYLLDMPHGFTWKGVYLDADVRAVEVVLSDKSGVGSEGEREKLFMQLSSLQGSVLEHKLCEDDFKVESISTAKLFQLTNAQPGTSILTIDKTNIDAILPTLDFADNIKEDIRNSVNQNYAIRIPQSEITYHDWIGIGYIKENPETGESGWMLSGMIAGGSSVDSPEKWAEQYLADVLGHPYGGEFNSNPLAAAKIVNIEYTDRQRDYVNKTLERPLAVLVLDSTNKPVKAAKVTFTVKAGGGTVECLAPSGGGPIQPDICETLTGSNGIAKARHTLGKETGKNPIYMTLDKTDVNSTQVGLNLVDAYIIGWGGQVALNHPFEAYGLPDINGLGKRIETVFPKGTTGTTVVSGVTITSTDIAQSGMPNNPGGSLLGRLVDRYGNPISNARLLFTSLLATSHSPTIPLPQEARKVMFYDSAACTVAYPLYGECGPHAYDETATSATDYNGGMTTFVYGNSVNTDYTLLVTVPSFTDVPPIAWTLHVGGYAASSDAFFNIRLEIGSLDLYSVNGDLVNAVKAGEELKADLKAKLYLIQSDFTVDEAIDACKYGQVTLTCQRVQPKGTITTVPVSYGLVTFKTATGNGIPLSPVDMGNGLYQAKYKTDTIPAKNIIEALGEAAITVPVMYYDDLKKAYVKLALNPVLVTLKTGQTVYFVPKTGSTHVGICGSEQGTNDTLCVDTDDPKYLQKTTYTAFGIGVDTVVEPSIVLLDDLGRTTVDTTIKYTVQPAEYKAALVDIDLLKAINSIDNVWMDVLYADQTQGQGSAVIVKGSKTDVNSLYKAQVVMNRGSMMEVKGKEKNIPAAQIRVLQYAAPNRIAEEIRYGRGSNSEKAYYVQLKSQTLKDACAGLAGKIQIVDQIGQLTTAPPANGDEVYAAEYQLKITTPLLIGDCDVEIVDTLDSGSTKSKFIVSNLSRNTLNAGTFNINLWGKSVLYGGIGNQIVIEINGVKKYVPIEHVGIIVLGIDGLRQDVLYDGYDASYSDPFGCGGNICYVQASDTNLPGLSQILQPGSTIKLKDVTAIFPSITLASWASIFTGKMPNVTGITGNEYYARDLAYSVPARFNNPIGMITYDSGAFKGYDEFPKKSMLLDDDFLIPSRAAWTNTIDPIGTPQNSRLMLTADTIFETITGRTAGLGLPALPGMTNVRNYFQKKGGDPVVVANNHYARGARWMTWRLDVSSGLREILDQQSWARFEDYLMGNYKTTLNSRNAVPFSALTVWYLPGLDHIAHEEGMGAYTGYFKTATDNYIKLMVADLKNLDEFDNKIFIIVADHGHTAMPLPEQMTLVENDENGNVIKTWQGNASCKLNVDGFGNKKVQMPEQANNNLHIWELGEVLKAVGNIQGTSVTNKYKVLAPQEIASIYIDDDGDELPAGATHDIVNTDVIAGLNGPMAHIYVQNGSSGRIAEIFRLMLQMEDSAGALKWLQLEDIDYKQIRTTTSGKLQNSIDKILIRINGNYCVFDGLNEDGSANCAVNEILLSLAYVDAWTRINGMNNINRSGDIVLIMNDATLGNATDRYTTGVACKSWHASLNPSDSYIPFIFAYPGGNKVELETMLKKDAVCGTGYGNCKANWKLPDIVKEIISEQYK